MTATRAQAPQAHTPWLALYDDHTVRVLMNEAEARDAQFKALQVTDHNVDCRIMPLTLAASAPGLLAALERADALLVDLDSSNDRVCEDHEFIRAAIRAARGQS